MKNFPKIFSAILITINTAVISLIGGPALAIISALTLNTGLSLSNFENFFISASIVLLPLFFLVFSIHSHRNNRYGMAIVTGIIILLAIIILLDINFIAYKSAILG